MIDSPPASASRPLTANRQSHSKADSATAEQLVLFESSLSGETSAFALGEGGIWQSPLLGGQPHFLCGCRKAHWGEL